jgi:NADPH2:quinone reductase
LPSGLGSEAAGTVAAVGEGVTRFKIGERVGYCSGAIGSYAEANNVPEHRLVHLPDSISDELAAAILLKGMTAQYLIRQIHPVKAGETIVFHAAAGGVGQIGVQWAKHLGATVIGTTTSPQKVALAKANGCAHVLNSKDAGWEKQVREITGGKGVPVVYDSVGKTTFENSLKCLAPRGILASFGESSGDPPLISARTLGNMGSLFVTHPSLIDYTATRADFLDTTNDLFAMVASGKIKIEINREYPLREAAAAHADVEARKTTGSVVLIP